MNYDGSIDLKDLAKMDEQWGNSLHSALMTEDTFTGTNGSIKLTDISLGDQEGTADNSEFIDQNATENTNGFVDTLADAGSAGYNEEAVDSVDGYGFVYDANNNS